MAKKPNPDQNDLFDDWLVLANETVVSNVSVQTQEKESDDIVSIDKSRPILALRLAEKLDKDGEITSKFLTDEANRVFGGTQAEGVYSSKDAYDAMEAAFNIHLANTEKADWIDHDAAWAKDKASDLTRRIQKLPTQTRRDEEMDEFQQFSTPPALSFVANWVANVKPDDVMMEPSAGTGDLAIWSKIAGAAIVLNELSQRRQALLADLFPQAKLFQENAEQLNNVLPTDTVPSVIVMNPPFSSTAGRVQGQRDTTNGARHIEQALKRLQDGGRLVAIVGNGMAADRPAFSQWWGELKEKYTVRANIGISGKEYAKYGTTFDNQILVIDKTGATTQPILTGKVESVADLPLLLEDIRNERQHIQPGFIKPAIHADTQAIQDTLQPGNGAGGSGSDTGSTGTESVGNRGDSGTLLTDSQTSGESTVSDVVNDGIRTGSGVHDGSAGVAGGRSGGDTGGNTGVTEGNGSSSIAIEAKSGQVSEFTDSVFSNYTPQRLTILGAQQHPGKLVQSAAMSAVEPPAPTYAPVLPNTLIQEGLLSIAQLEALVYAGQAHSDLLPNGSRKGFFIGDGTGVGKGREISGIILDNMMQGRNKAVWVSFNEGLIEDARRDFSGIGGDPGKLFFQGKTKAGNDITHSDGILFTTYSTLRGGEKKQANDQGQQAGKTRAQQIIAWLGEDFDGVIAFDEAHSMGNAIAVKGKRGVKKPSQQALAGINLQRELPNARVVYVSATGATEISNLSYADRLGLWGEGTPFADVNTFINGVSKGGIASMELISRDMKAMGMYIARSLSYDGVSYERLEHTLSDLQEDIYNELAGSWQIVLNNVEQALEITQAGSSGNGKSAAMAQFWGAHQRFFNQVITAMQTPCVIDDIRRQLDAGHVAVIQLVNTNEAAQERIIADATANDAALEDLDFTPRQMLMDYVRHGFPVAAYQESKDDNGNTVYVPVKDSEGNPVFDREAIALRDALLETLQQIRVPENPLDSIINAFGSDIVAEVTGRSRRFVQTRDEEGNLKVVEEKRGKHSSRADAEAFQNDKKKILVFSGAGGTGYSFHADNTAENQRKRIHYILQPGWRADAAVQGFGRTHRTNQANEPHYVLPTTNLKAQKRFVSSIARRLDQLGALTRGQREATSQGMFTAADNLESQYATTALNNFFSDLYRGKTGLSFHDITKQMGLNLLDENAAFSESKIPAIPQFLNRLLSLKTSQQNAVFGEFENRLVEAVEYAKQQGLFDVGLQTLTAASIKKTRDNVAYEDKKTGAQTRYVELAVTNTIDYYEWQDAQKIASRRHADDLSGWFVSEFGKNKGDVFFLADIGERLDSEGHAVRRGIVHTIKKNGHHYVDNADILQRGWEHRTVSVNSVHTYQKVTLTKAIDEIEAEELWTAQVDNAPKTETKTERMLVGVILPIWDRVEGSETIKRLQTDEGEQLLGRMMGPKSAKQTLKNLGLESDLINMSSRELFSSIKNGNKAILSNGWEIAIAKVNHEDRIEIKGRSYLTDAEKRVLKDQGAFIERISWADRVFIPTGENGVEVFARITASKPVVELVEKNLGKEIGEEQAYGIHQITTNENAIPDTRGDSTIENVSGGLHLNSDSHQEVISMDKKKAFHETVAEKLIEQLKQGTAPWQKPWQPGEYGSFLPFNPVTGNRYKGINVLHLISQERDDQRWMTYKQAADAGAQVRKGEKGTGIQYWKFSDEHIKKDAAGKPILDGDGKPVKEIIRLERPRAFFATVFNAEQIDGLPPIQRKEQTWNPIERAEGILAVSGAEINHNGGSRAFYRPSTDSIHLPDKEQFPNAENYYATALHELGHWTGHQDRLDRDLAHPFGSEGYAKEELRAEIASMILGDELGIGHDPSQHAAYVGSWIKKLQDDPLEVFRAAADAEKIQAYVLGLEQKQVQDLTAQWQQDQDKDALSAVLAVGIESVLQRSEDVNFDHYQDYEGESMDAALRHHGFNTVGDITGTVPGQFFDTAIQQLSPVFGIDPADENMNNAYLERKGLAQAFQLMAEQLVAAHQQKQVENSQPTEAVMPAPKTIDTGQLVHVVITGIENAKADITAWSDSAVQAMAYDQAALAIEFVNQGVYDKALERLRAAAELEGVNSVDTHFRVVADTLEEGWRTWQQAAGVGQSITPEMKRSFESLPADLSLLSSATADDYRKASELARLEEEAVKNNPNSTAEDVTAAREQRKTADLAATIHDNDFQKKVAEIEQQKGQLASVQSEQNTDNAMPQGSGQSDKTYIHVPYREKNEAKAIGASWDRGQQSWYIPAGIDQTLFSKWSQAGDSKLTHQIQTTAVKAADNEVKADRQYLAVPYSERIAAKADGALWDKEAKSWYAGPKADMSKLQRWLPENVGSQQAPAMTPREEFSEALHALGCVVKDQHPVMDGKTHRIETVGDKSGERSGFYVGHLDGHPAGHIQNNRTGESVKWKAKGYSLSAADKAQLQADSAAKLQAREVAQKARQNTVAVSVRELLAVAPPAPADHNYLLSKQVRPGDLQVVPIDGSALPADSVVMIGKDWKESKALRETNPDKLVFTAGDLLLTAQDVNSEIRSVQSIQESGIKRFAAGGAKQDMFHVVGGQGLDALEKAPAIVISEGYATADTLSQSLGYATVAAFDSGNLPHVARLLREKFPDKPFVIAGDNDLHQELTEGKNPGKEKALAAAKAVDGTAIFPIFAKGEQMYPANLEPVTPAKARSGDLSNEQQEAIDKMKRYTDFNDLATKSVLGREGVGRQVTVIVNSIVERQEEQLAEQWQQERVEKLEQKQQHRRGIRV